MITLVVGISTGIIAICLKYIQIKSRNRGLQVLSVALRYTLGPCFVQTHILVGIHILINLVRGKLWQYKLRIVHYLFQVSEYLFLSENLEIVLYKTNITTLIKKFAFTVSIVSLLSYMD